jgi:glycosyltransferase involved in cell wall biosynthesis
MTEPRVKTLVVRGDLNSSSGYAQAISLYVERLAPSYAAILGVDLHHHESTHLARWPYPVISDAQLGRLCGRPDVMLDVLTVSTPDDYERVPHARNFGLFFWETDRLGRPDWITRMNTSLDEVWIPAQFMAEMLRDEGLTLPLVHRPCPLPSTPEDEVDDAVDGLLMSGIERGSLASRAITFDEVRSRHPELLLSTGTLIPRKGFPLLAHEWFRLAAASPDTGLIVKLGTIDVTKSESDVLTEGTSIFRRTAQRLGATPRGVYLLVGRLSNHQMNELTRQTDAFVTTSVGEGFGLGIFESLRLGRPALCPRHTSLTELLPEDYRYFLDTDWVAVGLGDPTGLYPISARWGLPVPGSLCDAHARLTADRSTGEVDDEVKRALVHAEEASSRFWGRRVA